MDTPHEALTIFVEKANEMRASGMWRRYYGQRQQICFSFGIDRATQQLIDTEFAGPDADTLAALLLPLRMFLQTNDRASFRRLRTQLQVNPRVVSPTVKRQILSQMAESDRSLDEPVLGVLDTRSVPEALVGPEGSCRPVTRREVLRTFLYGHYAHTSETFRPQYLSWKSSPRGAFFEFVFVSAVSDLLCTTLNIADLLGAELCPAP